MTEGKPNSSGQGDWQQKMEQFLTARRNLDEAAQELESSAKQNDEQLPAGEESRRDVSAATIGRMLGLVTAGDFKLMESKIDLLQTRVNTLMAKVDRLQPVLQTLACGSDMERLEVQLQSIKALMAEIKNEVKRPQQSDAADAEKSERLRSNIVTNMPPSGSKFVSRKRED